MYQLYAASSNIGWAVYGPALGMVVLILLGVPIWVVLGLGTTVLLSTTDVMPLTLIGETLFSGVDSFSLIAVPLFILTGDVVVTTRMSEKLLGLAEAALGWIRSGLGTSTVLGCGFFACISGSDAADAAALGRITVPHLVAKGYPLPYACALVASGATTGILIPPSISYIIIGLTLGISASTLFLAAAIPGALVLLTIILTNVAVNRSRGYEKSAGRFSAPAFGRAFWAARYALLVPFIILGGIYSGIFTPTESASVAVLTAIAVGFGTRQLKLSDFPRMMERSAEVNGVIAPIIGIALLLAQALAALDVPQAFVNGITAATDSAPLVILLMLAVFLIAGCVMETTPNIVILAPLMLPLASEIGMDPIHFCIFMVTALGVGFITPPLGLNLFVLSGLTGEPVLKIAARAVPFVLSMLVIVVILAFVPWLSLWAL
ncbi:MAG: C4-dicarboxylate ABC transporter [Rhodospirillales bacterium CG15_BIG_FIL_POST_REV_8_21_14_020_66_15]|nr:MAG: C4-dicarboxylate ABC transporter [Rhodospirillales bacterium CG15_BIG_FIL_POST_REV_8_21_14_020_66_15]